jgi:hypothetical protein
MTADEVEALLLREYNLRADAATRRYAAERLSAANVVPFAILAGDARTGLPVRREIAPVDDRSTGS